MPTAYAAAATVAAYLIGSLSFAVIVSRLMGLNDPRTYGSGNPGATNVLRSGNKAAAVLTLLLDALKGFLPVWLVAQFGGRFGLGEGSVALVGIAAFVGHLWPVFFRFEGGKGVATAAGVLLGINWMLGLATLATWLIVAFFFRYSSLAALVSAVSKWSSSPSALRTNSGRPLARRWNPTLTSSLPSRRTGHTSSSFDARRVVSRARCAAGPSTFVHAVGGWRRYRWEAAPKNPERPCSSSTVPGGSPTCAWRDVSPLTHCGTPCMTATGCRAGPARARSPRTVP
jgi:glycerol-3-phosphate acyltransferase PlsY